MDVVEDADRIDRVERDEKHRPGSLRAAGIANARVAREDITWARTWEDSYAQTLETKHYKLLYLRNADRLKERIAALS